ncbi:MAG: caspase family protein, partial [Alphaproteobacteria bacterium]|nr:caspase family protein [Alphaproteobacteria bacterium]
MTKAGLPGRGTKAVAGWGLAPALLALVLIAAPAAANPDAIAVIVGNKTYGGRVPAVEFAHRDAEAFKRYVIDVLGFDGANVIDLRDATKADFENVFGNERQHQGRLWRYVDPRGRSDVVVFYSGHGVPSLKDSRGYLLPVDADPDAPELAGFALDTLYANLTKLEARTVTVFLDACFSGESAKGMLIRATSGISVIPRLPAGSGKLAVLTAAQGSQVASWDESAKHGLFTHHLLDALHGAADAKEFGNGDGRIELGEIKAYLDRHMTRAARRTFGRIQEASLVGEVGRAVAVLDGGKKPIRARLDDARTPAKAPTAPTKSPTRETANLAPEAGTSAPAAKPANAFQVLLPTGVTLGDWAMLAEDRLKRNEFAALIAEADAHTRAHGAFPEVVKVRDAAVLGDVRARSGLDKLERAAQHRARFGAVAGLAQEIERTVAALVQGIAADDDASARAALATLSAIERTAGDALPLLQKRAAAHHRLVQYDDAERAYSRWLQQAPPDHPDRKRMALGLFKAQKREPAEPAAFKDCGECPEMVVIPAGEF